MFIFEERITKNELRANIAVIVLFVIAVAATVIDKNMRDDTFVIEPVVMPLTHPLNPTDS